MSVYARGETRRVGGFLVILLAAVSLPSCSRLLGWGVLLWSSEEPPIPSGTVLPVYIRSNIDQVWVAGIPDPYRQGSRGIDKFEVPLSQLELMGRKKKARERAAAFAPLALTYAETLQDGLPIREAPDNSARRVYRLKQGQIIKILAPAQGSAAISTTGEPLEGEWFLVLTEDGSTGYCFSYRLKLFEHAGGALAAVTPAAEETEDADLEMLLAKTWSPESYGVMINSGKIHIGDLRNHWGFSPGPELGLARIHLPGTDRTFSYTRIKAEGNRSWRFEGAPLQMSLRSDTTLAVRYTEEGGSPRTLLFVALPGEVDDIIVQETGRRELLFKNLYDQGPVYTSSNYGTLAFSPDGTFTWSGYGLLVPQIIPYTAPGKGVVDMGLFLAPSLAAYDGAFSLIFSPGEPHAESGNGSGDPAPRGGPVRAGFIYTLDTQGFRIEYVPPDNLESSTVVRRSSSPTVIYFFRAAGPPPVSGER